MRIYSSDFASVVVAFTSCREPTSPASSNDALVIRATTPTAPGIIRRLRTRRSRTRHRNHGGERRRIRNRPAKKAMLTTCDGLRQRDSSEVDRIPYGLLPRPAARSRPRFFGGSDATTGSARAVARPCEAAQRIRARGPLEQIRAVCRPRMRITAILPRAEHLFRSWTRRAESARCRKRGWVRHLRFP